MPETGPTPRPVADLIASARAGDAAAKNDLFDYCHGFLSRMFAHRDVPWLRPRQGRSDLAQSAMLRVIGAFDQSFRGSTEAELQAWLCRVATSTLNNAIEHEKALRRDLRKEVRIETGTDSQDDTPIPAAGPTPSGNLQEQERKAKLQQALAQLSDEHQAAIHMRLTDMSFAEIGRALGRSEEAARKLHARAVLELRGLLQEEP